MKQMPTRLRNNRTIRSMVKENRLNMAEIIYPVFLVEGHNIKTPISSLKNQYHYSVDALIKELPFFKAKGVCSLLLFASTNIKSPDGSSGAASDGIVQEAIRQIKAADDQMYIIADVCLCQSKQDGHCCIYHNNQIDNAKTLEVLSQIALSYAKAGVDMVAPSDMMDGRVAAIRETLDKSGYDHVAIMAYSAKYASAFYGPFREAAHSSPAFGDRKSYQMDPANRIEAKREVGLDLNEGADIVMVKPALAYLDVIMQTRQDATVPVAAYQVSGEYAMLVNAVDQKIFSRRAIYESLVAIKRAGASLIITYFALEIMNLIESEENC